MKIVKVLFDKSIRKRENLVESNTISMQPLFEERRREIHKKQLKISSFSINKKSEENANKRKLNFPIFLLFIFFSISEWKINEQNRNRKIQIRSNFSSFIATALFGFSLPLISIYNSLDCNFFSSPYLFE